MTATTPPRHVSPPKPPWCVQWRKHVKWQKQPQHQRCVSREEDGHHSTQRQRKTGGWATGGSRWHRYVLFFPSFFHYYTNTNCLFTSYGTTMKADLKRVTHSSCQLNDVVWAHHKFYFVCYTIIILIQVRLLYSDVADRRPLNSQRLTTLATHRLTVSTPARTQQLDDRGSRRVTSQTWTSCKF